MFRAFSIISVLMLETAPAYADMVWPALYLEMRLFSWWAIGLGLVVEFFFIWKVFSLSPKDALKADLAANAASAFLGVLLIPLAGIAWEIFPGLAVHYLLNWQTFSLITWGSTFILACLINACLENKVLARFFNVPLNRRTLSWLVLANSISVGIALASLWWHPIQP